LSFFRKKPKFEVEVVPIKDEMISVGISIISKDEKLTKDASFLQKEFEEKKSDIKEKRDPWGMTIITYNKDANGSYEYFIGEIVTQKEINEEKFKVKHIPEGLYAHINVKYKGAIRWAIDIAKARRFFHEKWLPTSQYEMCGPFVDMEFYSSKSRHKYGSIDLYFPIIKK